jgi:multiple antibiotic resistance protein
MHEQLQAIITVLSLINPAICAAMFARAVAGQSLGEKITDSARAALRS